MIQKRKSKTHNDLKTNFLKIYDNFYEDVDNVNYKRHFPIGKIISSINVIRITTSFKRGTPQHLNNFAKP